MKNIAEWFNSLSKAISALGFHKTKSGEPIIMLHDAHRLAAAGESGAGLDTVLKPRSAWPAGIEIIAATTSP